MDTNPVLFLTTAIGEFFDFVIECVGNVIHTIVDKPVLLIPVVGFLVVGFAVGVVNRLMRSN